jgi:hypothetical protein
MRARAQSAIYWPGMSQQLIELIDTCHECLKNYSPHREPLIPSELAAYPWQRVALDVADIKGRQYLVLVDYFSRYPEVQPLSNISSKCLIKACKETFSRYGIPELIRCDNAPPLVSAEFLDFLSTWGIKQVTSSPRFPQSNGEADAAVKIVKRIYHQADPYLGLLAYRNTPLVGLGVTPAQLAMIRHIRSTLPQDPATLQPQVVPIKNIQQRDERKRLKQKEYFDKRHGAKTMAKLFPGEMIWVKDKACEGRVVRHAAAPRSYIIETARAQIRRNRMHLSKIPVTGILDSDDSDLDIPDSNGTAAPVIPNDDMPPPAEEIHLDQEENGAVAPHQQNQNVALLPPLQEPAGHNPQMLRTRSGRAIKTPARYKK